MGTMEIGMAGWRAVALATLLASMPAGAQTEAATGEDAANAATFSARDASASSADSSDPETPLDTAPVHDATVGTLAGSAATDGGAASYTVPIVVPPGRAGMQPTLSLSYNSRGGDGVMGMGWSIGGMRSIHRCPQTPEQDGATKGVSYATGPAGDRLCLDGQRLVSRGGAPYGSAATTYATEVDSYARITQVGGDLAGNGTCFKVEEKSGRILHFGAIVAGTTCTAAGGGRVQPTGAPATLTWLLVKVEDRVGNNQIFSYTNYGNGEILLSGIAYTGFGSAVGDRSVSLSYFSRASASAGATDIASTYLAGGLTMQTQALASITTKVGTATVRRIAPTYATSTYSGRLMLATLTECAYSGATSACHPATRFVGSNEGTPSPSPTFHLSSLASLNLPQAVRQPTLTIEEEAVAAAQRLQHAPDVPQTDPAIGIVQLALLAGDMDGDGTREMAFGISQSDGQHDYLVQLAADRQVRGAVDVTGMLCYSPDCFGDFAGDGRSEVVLLPRSTTGYIQFGMWTLGRGVIAPPGSHPIQLIASNIAVQGSAQVSRFAAPHAVDINGDGKLDIVLEQALGCGVDAIGSPKAGVFAYINVTQVDPATHTISAAYPPRFTIPAAPLFCLGRTTLPQGVITFGERIDHIADFNGDGLPDIFVSDSFASIGSPTLTQVRLTQVAGGVPSSGAPQSCAAIGLVNSTDGTDECKWSNGYVIHWMDVNADGLDDFVFARPNGGWQVRLNVGGHLGSLIATSGSGSRGGLDSYPTPRSDQPGRYSFKYANRVPVMDVDSDGKGDLLVVSAQQGFALKMCSFYRLPISPIGELCGTGPVEGAYCPAYACPPDPGTGTYNMPGQPHALGRWQGSTTFPMYDSFIDGNTHIEVPDLGYADSSAYHLAAVKFVQTGSNTIEARLSETTLVSSLLGGNADPTSGVSADVFGEGLGDLIGNLGCEFESTVLGSTTYPGCLLIGVAPWGPATLQTYATPTSPTPTAVPTSSFAGINPVYINQNIGTGLGGGAADLLADVFPPSTPTPFEVDTTLSSPGLPDLLLNVNDGLGDYAAWAYAVLSLPLIQGPLSLYTVPASNGYVDTRHYYFTSSMPVVSGMVQNNGVGGQYGFRSAIYGYSEAMYNHLGRGFQGFRTISSIVATLDTTRWLQTRTAYNQKFPLTGKVASIAMSAPNSVPPVNLQTEIDTWICGRSGRTACLVGDALPAPTGNTVYAPLLDKRSVARFDLAGGGAVSHTDTINATTAATGVSGWDGYGNLTAQLVTSGDDGGGGRFVDSQVVGTISLYAPADVGTWWIDKLDKRTTTTSITYNAANHALPAGAAAPTRTVASTYLWNSDRTPLAETFQAGVANQERSTGFLYPTPSYGQPTGVNVYSPSASPASRNTSYVYSKDGATPATDGYFVLTTTSPLAHTVTTEHSARDGQTSRIIDPNGLKTVNTFDVFGRVTQTDFLDATGAALYQPRQTSLTRCTGSANSTCAGGFGEDGNQAYAAYRSTTVQGGNATTADWFDVLGRSMKQVRRSYQATFIETITDYDDMNVVSMQSVPFFVGSVPSFTAWTYDRLNRPVLKQSPGAEADPAHGDVVTQYTYSGARTAIKVRAASVAGSGNCPASTSLCMDMTRSYDVLGRLEQTSQSNGVTTAYAITNYWYDGVGNPVGARDAEGNVLSATYNDAGHRLSMTDPDARTSNFVYDGFGQLLSQTDARGVQTVHSYDALGRLRRRVATDPGASDTNLRLITDSWGYDPVGGKGLLDFTIRATGASTASQAQIWKNAYAYQPATKFVSSETATLQGQPIDWVTRFTYDTYGREATVAYPNSSSGATGLVVRKGYKSNGELSILSNDVTGQLYWRGLANDAWGNALSEDYLGGLITGSHTAYASTGQMRQKKWSNASSSLDLWAYAYDSFGNLSSQGHTQSAVTTNEYFTYDALQRLIQDTRLGVPGNPSPVTYRYTPSGNLDYKSDYSFAVPTAYQYGGNGCGPHAVSVVVRSGTSNTYACDASGNVVGGNTLTATYDFNNQPWSISRLGAGVAQFAYDANANRFKELASTHSTWFGARGFERTVTGPQITDRHELGPVEVIRIGSTYTVRPQFRDRLGSTVALANDNGTLLLTSLRGYDAFGKVRNSDFTDRPNGTLNLLVSTLRGFTGHEHVDDVWLIHMNGRVYDYQLGRFLSVDPVIQFPTNSQSLNPYSYVLNNPLSGRDPSGYAKCSVNDNATCLETGSNQIFDDSGKFLGKAMLGANTLSFAPTAAGRTYLANGANARQDEKSKKSEPASDHNALVSRPSISDQIFHAPTALGVDPNNDRTLEQRLESLVPGVGFAQCFSGSVECSGAETAMQAASVPLGFAVGAATSRGLSWLGSLVGRSATQDSVWALGPGPRGEAIEQALGQNLPKPFPIIDRFSNGLATSIKSMDLGAATYQNPAALTRTLNGYLTKLSSFQGGAMGNQAVGTAYGGSAITGRQLQLAIPSGYKISGAQQAAINAAAANARQQGMSFVVTPFP